VPHKQDTEDDRHESIQKYDKSENKKFNDNCHLDAGHENVISRQS